MKMRRAGERRHYVEFQSQDTAATSTGFGGDWDTYGRAWAEVLPAPAGQSERIIANTTDASITHIVECDYRTDVRINHRIRMAGGNLLYVVGTPQNLEMRNKTLAVPCEERAA